MSFQGKQLITFIFIPAIVVIVGVAAFGLGRLSGLQTAQSSIVIHPAPYGSN